MNGWNHITHLSEVEKRLTSLWFKVNPADIDCIVTGTIIGEMPGKNTRSILPLFPYPPNSSGGRLMQMGGLPIGIYIGRLKRVNLFDHHVDIWNAEEANLRAVELMKQMPDGHRVVLCGKQVGKAFGLSHYFENAVDETEGTVHYTCIPHPSARNRIYDDPMARTAARMAIQWAADHMVAPKETK